MKRKSVIFVITEARELPELITFLEAKMDEDETIEITFRFGNWIVSVLTSNTDKYKTLKELY